MKDSILLFGAGFIALYYSTEVNDQAVGIVLAVVGGVLLALIALVEVHDRQAAKAERLAQFNAAPGRPLPTQPRSPE